jgi:hypothetical protein
LTSTTFTPEYISTCKKAAQQGNVIAQNTLGYIYLHGQGVEKDYKEAVKWFEKSANQAYPAAQFNLAIMYKLGQGVEVSHPESIKWMQLAANQNYAQAQSHLGNMYYQGLAVMQDFEMAYMWWTLAEKNGVNELDGIKHQLKTKMTANQITQAEQAVEQWIRKH